MTFDDIAKEAVIKHQRAFENWSADKHLYVGGYYQWKRKGEAHLFNPTTIHLLQKSSQNNDYGVFKQYAKAINDQSERHITLRSLLDFNKEKSIPLVKTRTANWGMGTSKNAECPSELNSAVVKTSCALPRATNTLVCCRTRASFTPPGTTTVGNVARAIQGECRNSHRSKVFGAVV